MSKMRRFVEEIQFKSAAVPKNWTGAASTSGYLQMKGFQSIVFVITTGAWAAGTAAVTVKEALTSGGGTAQSLDLDVYWLGGLADVMVETAVVSDTFNLSAANKRIVIQVNASQLDSADDYDFVQLLIASPGANADFYSVVAFGYNPALKTTPDLMQLL